MTLPHGIRTVQKLGEVGASDLRGLGLKSPSTSRLETLKNVNAFVQSSKQSQMVMHPNLIQECKTQNSTEGLRKQEETYLFKMFEEIGYS